MTPRRRSAMVSFIASLILIQFLFPPAHPEVPRAAIEYDDGGADYCWSDYYPNGAAVRFTPPVFPWKTTAILLYSFIIDKGEKSFLIEIRDGNFKLVYKSSYSTSKYYKNATLDWARIPLPNMTVRGDFYVCVYPMLEPEGTQLWIGVDNDTICGRSFLVDCYEQKIVKEWETKQGKGNVMIRVEGEEAISFAEAVLNSISITEDGVEIALRIIMMSNVSEVRANLQHGYMVEDCEVNRKGEVYSIRIEWSKIQRLAQLTLVVTTSDSTTVSTIEIGEVLWSKYLELKGENRRLIATINSSKLEWEALERQLDRKDLDIAALNASLAIYERRWSDSANKVKELNYTLTQTRKALEELNTQADILKVTTALFSISTVLLLVVVFKRRSRFNPTRNEIRRATNRGKERCSRKP